MFSNGEWSLKCEKCKVTYVYEHLFPLSKCPMCSANSQIQQASELKKGQPLEANLWKQVKEPVQEDDVDGNQIT